MSMLKWNKRRNEKKRENKTNHRIACCVCLHFFPDYTEPGLIEMNLFSPDYHAQLFAIHYEDVQYAHNQTHEEEEKDGKNWVLINSTLGSRIYYYYILAQDRLGLVCETMTTKRLSNSISLFICLFLRWKTKFISSLPQFTNSEIK